MFVSEGSSFKFLILYCVKQAQEKGAGSWLSVLPLEDQGFTLTKSEFRDSLALRYNRPLRGLPLKCPWPKI